MSWLSSGLRKIGGVAARAIPGGQALEALVQGGSFTDNLKKNLGRDASIASLAGGGAVGGVAGGALGGGSTASKVLGGLKTIAPLAMGGASLYEGYKNDKKAQKLSDKQLALAEQSYNERLPMRTLGRDLMLDQTPPDLSYIYANSSNPFAKRAG